MEEGVLQNEENRLKRNILSNLEAQFVDEFLKWRERVDLFNLVVKEYNKMSGEQLGEVAYDEFCALFVNGSKEILDEYIKVENIVPNANELDLLKTTLDSADADDFKRHYTSLLEAKYANVRKNLAQVWDGHVFRSMITEQYGDRHYDGMVKAKEKVMEAME